MLFNSFSFSSTVIKSLVNCSVHIFMQSIESLCRPVFQYMGIRIWRSGSRGIISAKNFQRYFTYISVGTVLGCTENFFVGFSGKDWSFTYSSVEWNFAGKVRSSTTRCWRKLVCIITTETILSWVQRVENYSEYALCRLLIPEIRISSVVCHQIQLEEYFRSLLSVDVWKSNKKCFVVVHT